MRMRDGEIELARLLGRMNALIDVDGREDDGPDLGWEVWESLPFGIREWLLAAGPVWWSLPAPVFRRLLLDAAGLIVWRGLSPSAALARAGTRLRLPPPRRNPARRAPTPPVRPPMAMPRPFRPLVQPYRWPAVGRRRPVRAVGRGFGGRRPVFRR